MNKASKLTPLVAVLVLAGCAVTNSLVGDRSGYEEPPYKVVEEVAKNLEVREYEARLVAEARVPNDGTKRSDNAAFRLLFNYISGANRSKAKVAMTVPVEVVEQRGEKVAMTVPVEVVEAESDWMAMRFFFPSKFTLETAPTPTDSRIEVFLAPAEVVAALRFSGRPGKKDIEKREAQLLEALASSQWQPVSEPTISYYNDPLTPGMFRRNEVMVRVERKAAEAVEAESQARGTQEPHHENGEVTKLGAKNQ